MTAKLFLVVEDQPELAERNCIFLNKVEANAHCVIAENPDQARERLKLEKPDLIVVDLMFKDISGKHSGESGLNLLRHLFVEYPQLNILVYTTDPNLLQPIIKEAQSHNGSFVVADKTKRRKDFTDKVAILLNHQGIKLIPSDLTKELDSIKLTSEELQILGFICQDCLTNKLIVEKSKYSDKAMSLKTVNNRTQSIRKKLRIFEDRNECDLRLLMCNKAREKGLIDG